MIIVWVTVAAPAVAQGEARWDVFVEDLAGGELAAANHITSLALQEGANILWIGTRGGLRWYDGRRVEDCDLDEGAGADDVRALVIDENFLWIATATGLFRLTLGQNCADAQKITGDLYDARTLSHAAGNGLWVGTGHRAVYWPASTSVAVAERRDFLRNRTVEAVWEQSANDLWFGTQDGVVHLDPTTAISETYTTSEGLPSPWVHALWRDGRGYLWVGTEAGACRLPLATPRAGCKAVDGVAQRAISGLFSGPDDSVWVATDEGLWRFQGDSVVEMIRPTRATGGQLHADDVRAVVQDVEGQLWIGTTGGLARRRAPVWEPVAGTEALGAPDVQAIVEDSANNLWAGTTEGLAWQDSAGEWHHISTLATQPVRCLAPVGDGRLWACLEQGIARVSPAGDVEFPLDDRGPLGLSVYAILTQADGMVWIATQRGVWHWNQEGSWRNGASWVAHLEDENVHAVTFDGAAGVWAGTRSGLIHFDGQQWVDGHQWQQLLEQAACATVSQATAPPDARGSTLVADPQGRLWVGTRLGLVLLQDGQSRCWDAEDGLVANHIRTMALEEGDAGKRSEPQPDTLWLGTFDGLSRVNLSEDPAAGLAVVGFSGNSLPHDRIQAIYVSRERGVLIGTPVGVWAYQPSPGHPQVHLCEGDCNTLLPTDSPREWNYMDSIESKGLGAVGGDLRTASGNLIYRYTAENNEVLAGWSSNGRLYAIRSLDDMLRPGDQLTLKVWAYDRDFNPSPEPVELQLVRQAVPIRNRRWFPSFLGVTGLVLIAGTVVGYRKWRRRGEHPYQDVELVMISGAEPNMFNVQLTTERWPSFRNRGRELNYNRELEEDVLESRLERLRGDKTNAHLLRCLGRQLYDTLLTPEATRHLRKHAGLGSKGVRLRLRLDAASELAGLPWEFLHGGDDLGFLTVQKNVALVRDLTPARPPDILIQRPLKVLIAGATPHSLSPIDIEDEVAAIHEALAPLVEKDRAVVKPLLHARPQTFVDCVIREGYDVIHFTGHGGGRDGEGVLYFEDMDGDPVSMTQRELVVILGSLGTYPHKTPKLVVLNACRTAEAASVAGVTGLAGALAAEGGLPAVVGMGYKITTAAAATFSRTFYAWLVRHGQVDHAVTQGRKALYGEPGGAAKRDWGTPRLYVRVPKGIVFDVTD